MGSYLSTRTGASHAFYPGGLDTLLALIGLGATGEAQTQLLKHFDGSEENMSNLLRKIGNLSRSGEVKTNNLVIFDTSASPTPDYVNKIMGFIQSTGITSNLLKDPVGSAKEINAWVEKESGLSNIIDPSSLTNTVVVMINTLWFKDKWVLPFEARRTRPEGFTNSSKQVTKIPMMIQKETFGAFRKDGVTAVKLQFQGGATAEFAMGLPVDKLFDQEITYKQYEIELHLPKFEHKETIDLVPIVNAIDCSAIFSPGSLSLITGSSLAAVTEMRQVIYVNFDEQGAEVKAVSSALMTLSMPTVIAFNKPFRYRIVKDDICLVNGFFDGK